MSKHRKGKVYTIGGNWWGSNRQPSIQPLQIAPKSVEDSCEMTGLLNYVKGCGAVTVPDVKLDIVAHAKLQHLCNSIRTEWLIYAKEVDGIVDLSHVFVPKQNVSAASVDVLDSVDMAWDVVIHSHHTMGAFHSGTDDTYLGNRSVSIVISDKGMIAKRKLKLDCGKYAFMDAKVVVSSSVDEVLVKAVEDKIAEGTPKVTSYIGGHGAYGGMGGDEWADCIDDDGKFDITKWHEKYNNKQQQPHPHLQSKAAAGYDNDDFGLGYYT